MSPHILLVDDDDVAAESVQRSMRKNGLNYPLTVAQDGLIALEILREMHRNNIQKESLLVLLDLNMPRMNGFEFLQTIRSDKDLKSIIVFVLTTSNSEEDKIRAYGENVAGYLVKDKVGPHFSKLFELLDKYTSAVSFPDKPLG